MSGITDFVTKIVGGSTTSTLEGISNIVDKFITTPDEKKKFIEETTAEINRHNEFIIGAATEAYKNQLDVNAQEAQNKSLFVSGWRPFVGWICGGGLAIQFIINPLATWATALLHHAIVFPSLDMGTLITLLTGMLGMGGLRTYEKLNGVAAK